MGMDLKYNKRYIIGILVITVIFGSFFFISMSRMLENKPTPIKKTDYMVMLEQEYENVEFNKEDDFWNFVWNKNNEKLESQIFPFVFDVGNPDKF